MRHFSSAELGRQRPQALAKKLRRETFAATAWKPHSLTQHGSNTAAVNHLFRYRAGRSATLEQKTRRPRGLLMKPLWGPLRSREQVCTAGLSLQPRPCTSALQKMQKEIPGPSGKSTARPCSLLGNHLFAYLAEAIGYICCRSLGLL